MYFCQSFLKIEVQKNYVIKIEEEFNIKYRIKIYLIKN